MYNFFRFHIQTYDICLSEVLDCKQCKVTLANLSKRRIYWSTLGSSHINGKAQKMSRNLGEDIPATQAGVGYLSCDDGGYHGYQCCSWTPGGTVTIDTLSTSFIFLSFPQDSKSLVGISVDWASVLLTARTGRGPFGFCNGRQTQLPRLTQ